MLKEKRVFGLNGKLILRQTPFTYYLAGINTRCIVCRQHTNRIAQHEEQTRPCCEKCFDTQDIDLVFIEIRKKDTRTKTTNLNFQSKVIYLSERKLLEVGNDKNN